MQFLINGNRCLRRGYGKSIAGYCRNVFADQFIVSAFCESGMVVVHGLYRCQSVAIGIHQLVSDDVDSSKSRGEIAIFLLVYFK